MEETFELDLKTDFELDLTEDDKETEIFTIQEYLSYLCKSLNIKASSLFIRVLYDQLNNDNVFDYKKLCKHFDKIAWLIKPPYFYIRDLMNYNFIKHVKGSKFKLVYPFPDKNELLQSRRIEIDYFPSGYKRVNFIK